MQTYQSDKFKDVFSFYGGMLSFFGLSERRIDRLRKAILSRSDDDALKEDFKNVGEDIRSSMKKHDTKKEVAELYLCD